MENKNAESNQPSASDQQLAKQESQETSPNLGKNLCLQLMSLIEQVNETEVTPQTVNASCNAAEQIHKMLKLNFEMKRAGF